MRCPTLAELPPPPPGKTGWPWTEESPQLPDTLPDGSPWPRISIVTPSYNQGRFIEETIRSVLLQGYPDLEYIIIDGGSTDESVEVIRKYEPWLAYWVSEPDRGQSHAINKGWERTTGDILAWLNSDDLYAPGALSHVGRAFARNPDCVVAGNVLNFEVTPEIPVVVILQQDLTWRRFVKFWLPAGSWHQPGIFFPRRAWRLAGPLDEQFHYCMDRDFLVRILQHAQVVYLNSVLAYFRLHPGSKTVQVKRTKGKSNHLFFEKIRVVEKYEHLLLEPQDHRQLVQFWMYLFGRHLLCGELRKAIRYLYRGFRTSQNEVAYALWHYLCKLLGQLSHSQTDRA